ncbi:DUF7793 family protein [Dinghuibacter silviterrae]|nr:hypothetical protein [Dinghuibacter silviterrae]
MSPILETEYVRFEMEGDILVATYKKGKKVDLQAAQQIVRDRVEYTGGAPVLVLLCNQGVISIDKESRAYLSSQEGTHGIKAAAILSDTAATAIIGNFIIQVNKPHIPVRLFINRDRALGWLKTKA